MSQTQVSTRVSIDRRQIEVENGNEVCEQVINNSMFKLLLKDMVQDLFCKAQKQQQEKEEAPGDTYASIDNFIDEIGESLMIIAKTEASKQIKQAEKFFADMYQHKVKELEDKFEEMVDNKLKELQERMQKMSQKNKIETSLLSPIRPPLKNKQLVEIPDNLSQMSQINKRLQLKQKILNSTINPDSRQSVINIELGNQSILSDFSNEASIERLTEKVRQIQESFKTEFKSISQKITAIKSQCKTQLDDTQASIKEQLHSGFEGIWNVISNLEKRMIV